MILDVTVEMQMVESGQIRVIDHREMAELLKQREPIDGTSALSGGAGGATVLPPEQMATVSTLDTTTTTMKPLPASHTQSTPVAARPSARSSVTVVDTPILKTTASREMTITKKRTFIVQDPIIAPAPHLETTSIHRKQANVHIAARPMRRKSVAPGAHRPVMKRRKSRAKSTMAHAQQASAVAAANAALGESTEATDGAADADADAADPDEDGRDANLTSEDGITTDDTLGEEEDAETEAEAIANAIRASHEYYADGDESYDPNAPMAPSSNESSRPASQAPTQPSSANPSRPTSQLG
jgi:hypothetical protein